MTRAVLIFGASALLSLAYASDQGNSPAPYRPFKGKYSVYSGELGEHQAPTRDDRKVSFLIEGKPAKDLFDSMPPDDKATCSGDKGARSRTKGSVWCTFQPGDGYTCYFGFDLRTGKSIGGGIC
jgi:hypothetical protein